jgi:hypothetical protein
MPFDSLKPPVLAERIGTAEAARRAGRSERTIREWCCLHRIGRRIGGRWAVSAVALDMLLNGDIQSLDAYLAGNRKLPAVVAEVQQIRAERARPSPLIAVVSSLQS